jgi:hypothetical protein
MGTVSFIEILAVIGVIGYVIFKQVRGEALRGKRAVLLPAILTAIGYGDLHGNGGAHLSHADVGCLVVGAAGSAVIGLAFGWITRLEERGGYLWAQLPVRGLWLWGAMLAWRVAVMGVAAAMHAHVAASSATLLFSLGVNRLAQAAVIVPRAMAMGVPFAPEKDGRVFMADSFGRGVDAMAQRRSAGDGAPWSQQGQWQQKQNQGSNSAQNGYAAGAPRQQGPNSDTPQDAAPWQQGPGSRWNGAPRDGEPWNRG